MGDIKYEIHFATADLDEKICFHSPEFIIKAPANSVPNNVPV